MDIIRKGGLRMAKALKTAGAIYAVGLMIFALVFCLAGGRLCAWTARDVRQSAEDEQAAAQAESQDEQLLLFPSLNAAAITEISGGTAGRSFRFDVDASGAVSVNGQQADSEIYMTLVEQISGMPIVATGAFSADGAQLLLELTVCADEEEHTACFYEDGDMREIARVVSGTADAPEYGQTSGWRVGTLMMTCEGTRIQDERGNERPASFSTKAHDRP